MGRKRQNHVGIKHVQGRAVKVVVQKPSRKILLERRIEVRRKSRNVGCGFIDDVAEEFIIKLWPFWSGIITSVIHPWIQMTWKSATKFPNGMSTNEDCCLRCEPMKNVKSGYVSLTTG